MWVYGMKMRGFSIGCQPKEGFVKIMDCKSNKYYDIIVYNRRLTKEEIYQYELDCLGTLIDLEDCE